MLAEGERDEPPAPKCAVSWEMTICVHSVHWFKAEENMITMKQYQNEKCTMKWGTCASEAYCRSWGAPDLEWDIHNQLQPAKVDLIEIQQCHSGLDCRSMLCLNFNHRPGNTQQQKVQLRHEYASRDSVSSTPGCRSNALPNDRDIPP